MPNWLQYVLALVGLGAKAYSDVKGGKPAKDAATDGVAQAAPVVTGLVAEASKSKTKSAN